MFDVDRLNFFAVAGDDLFATVSVAIEEVASFAAIENESRVSQQECHLVECEAVVVTGHQLLEEF